MQSTIAQAVTPNLTLTLEPGNTVGAVKGGGGTNTISGNSALDVITAGTGSNVVTPGTGGLTFAINADKVQGSETVDSAAGGGPVTLDFSATQVAALDLNLGLTTLQTVAPGLTLTLAPGVTVAGATGGAGNDTIVAGTGNETLDGGGGDNSFVFDADHLLGSDVITDKNQDAVNTLDFSPTQSAPVTVDLSKTRSQVVNQNLTLTLASGRLISDVLGGGGTNTITGNSLNNTITAGPTNNTLTAGTGNDTFIFDADTDRGSVAIGAVSGAGTATLDFSATQNTAITVNLGEQIFQSVAADLTLLLMPGNTVENVIGGAGDDTLIGNAGNNILTAGTGNVTLVGGGGTDVYAFPANPGQDFLFGALAGVADPNPAIVIPGSVIVQPGTAAGTMQLVAQNGGSVTFLDPATRVTINSGSLEITGVDPSNQGDFIFTGSQYLQPNALDLGASSLVVMAQSISITHNITTTGNITLDADAESFVARRRPDGGQHWKRPVGCVGHDHRHGPVAHDPDGR